MRIFASVLCFSALMALLIPAVTLAQDSFFDIWTEPFTSHATSYPNSGHQGDIAHMGGGSLVDDGDISVLITQCHEAVSGLDIPTDMTARDSGAGVGDFAVDSFFDIFYSSSSDTSQPPSGDFSVDSFFDITFNYNGVSGGPGTLVSLNTGFPQGDTRRYFDVYFVDSFFDITYEIEFDLGVHHQITLHGSVPPELGITNVSVGLGNPGSVDSFFDVFVEVSPNAPIDPLVPVLSIQQTGTFNTGPVPAASSSWGKIKSLYN